MLESSVMEYVKWFIGMVSLFFVITVVILMFRLGELNSFQQAVNYQIERHGGLTAEAIDELNTLSLEQYGGYLALSEDLSVNAGTTGDAPSGFYLQEIVATDVWNERVVEASEADYERRVQEVEERNQARRDAYDAEVSRINSRNGQREWQYTQNMNAYNDEMAKFDQFITPPDSDFEYVRYNDSNGNPSIGITRYVGDAEYVRVPNRIEGIPVRRVFRSGILGGDRMPGVFVGRSVKGLIIPSSVTHLSQGALKNLSLEVLVFEGAPTGGLDSDYLLTGSTRNLDRVYSAYNTSTMRNFASRWSLSFTQGTSPRRPTEPTYEDLPAEPNYENLPSRGDVTLVEDASYVLLEELRAIDPTLVDANGLRSVDSKARYGTTINYVLGRHIGNSQSGGSIFKPTVIGESASRVRGTSDY